MSAAMEFPEVNFSEHGDVRYLHLGTEWVQGSMLIDAPFDIELEYVQRMMAWLLFVDPASVPKRRVDQHRALNPLGAQVQKAHLAVFGQRDLGQGLRPAAPARGGTRIGAGLHVGGWRRALG